jgi:DNA (cytosine-5)-methyltransferase 1
MPVSRTRKKNQRVATATHRPALRTRHFQHDDLVAVDLFSGFGGLTKAIEMAGFTTILAANHNFYKTKIHEVNNPGAEHWIADLVDKESADYHDVRDLPAADLLAAGVSCRNHSVANTKRAYATGMTLFDLGYDEEYESQVTRSERDRATANCVLHYAQKHHPRMILVECTPELQSWGPALPNRPKVGDGTTFRWWLRQFGLLNYKYKIMYLNSMFFGVGQSRDRIFIAMWDQSIPDPDLEHTPEAYCPTCDRQVEARWTWKTGVPANGTVRYGQQYNYRCPSCKTEVKPPMTPSISALDLTDLGTRIGDKPIKTYPDGFVGPMARSSMGRAERAVRRFPEFPPILMQPGQLPGTHPWQTGQGLVQSTGGLMVAHRHNGDGRQLSEPMNTVTSTYEKGLVIAVNNYQGAPRGITEPFPTQAGSETLSLLSTGVMPFRQHTRPALAGEAMPTMTSDQVPGLVTTQQKILAGDSMLRDWMEALRTLDINDCFFRMLFKHEVGRACGFDPDFPGYEGTFIVWGTAQEQIDGYGNAVSPQVGYWIAMRLRASLHSCPV